MDHGDHQRGILKQNLSDFGRVSGTHPVKFNGLHFLIGP
jgi:hypothetical protein